MLKRLFHEEYESYNDEGRNFGMEFRYCVKRMFESYIDEGYSLNDIEKIALDEISVFMAEEKIKRNPRR